MARNMENVQKFIWKLENYSLCWSKTGEFLKSPDFEMKVYEGSSWCLKLYPRGVSSYGNYISVYLERLQSSAGPLGITIDFEICLLRPDGMSECTKEMKSRFFRKGHSFGFNTLALRDEITKTRKSWLLPEDVLTVQCCILPQTVKLKSYTEIIAKTHSEIESHRFLWEIDNNNFSFSGEHAIKFCRSGVGERVFKVFNDSTNKALQVRCCMLDVMKAFHSKVSIVDSKNSIVKTLMDENFERCTVCCSLFPLITIDELKQKKSLYMVNDKLLLLCDWTVSFGVQHSQIKVAYNRNFTFAPLNEVRSKSTCIESDEKAHLSQNNNCCSSPDVEPSSLQNDFQNLYSEGALSDFTINVESEMIRVHKAVLCARSPVFKAMLTSDMKETKKNLVNISDLDVGTVRRMLTFMYTDSTVDFNWESASKLYFAADKYGIMKLKDICSNVMKKNLCVENVGEALTLANVHGDEELKKLTLEFICCHYAEIIVSPEWKTFMTKDIYLAAEIMQFVLLKKTEN